MDLGQALVETGNQTKFDFSPFSHACIYLVMPISSALVSNSVPLEFAWSYKSSWKTNLMSWGPLAKINQDDA